MARSRLIAGPKVKLLINGKLFGRVVSFRWNSDTPKSAKYGIDSMQPYELASTITRGSGTMNVLRISGDGGAEGAGITAAYPDLSREKYFSVTLIELNTDLTLFQARKCSLVSQNWDISAKSLVSGSLSFEFIDFSNEIARFTQQ